jgi:transcriptional regulator with XRE-family HTH domain
MNTISNIRFEDWEAEQMQDPAFRAAVEELEPAYQIARLRIMRGLTQKQLAKMVGTKQSSISRLESGRTEPRLSFLRRVVRALRGRLVIRIMPQEEALVPAQPSVVAFFQSESVPPCVDNWPRPAHFYARDTVNTTILEKPRP